MKRRLEWKRADMENVNCYAELSSCRKDPIRPGWDVNDNLTYVKMTADIRFLLIKPLKWLVTDRGPSIVLSPDKPLRKSPVFSSCTFHTYVHQLFFIFQETIYIASTQLSLFPTAIPLKFLEIISTFFTLKKLL